MLRCFHTCFRVQQNNLTFDYDIKKTLKNTNPTYFLAGKQADRYNFRWRQITARNAELLQNCEVLTRLNFSAGFKGIGDCFCHIPAALILFAYVVEILKWSMTIIYSIYFGLTAVVCSVHLSCALLIFCWQQPPLVLWPLLLHVFHFCIFPKKVGLGWFVPNGLG